MIGSNPFLDILLEINGIANTSLAAKGALAHRLQRRTACKIQYGCQGAPKWLMGSGHYIIASSRLPERQPLERRTLVPIIGD